MRILCPLPQQDFDPTEAAVSWKILTEAGHAIVFATPEGSRAYADPRMISGEGLDVWGWLPVLNKFRLIGLLLRADSSARRAYREMERDPCFQRPLRYEQLVVKNYDALLLPGGHAKGMRPYLENAHLQSIVAEFFDADKPVAAVCHGVVLAARSVSKKTGRSVLFGRKTTALTWKLEQSAWQLTRYFARFWDATYYRTYVEAEGEPAAIAACRQKSPERWPNLPIFWMYRPMRPPASAKAAGFFAIRCKTPPLRGSFATGIMFLRAGRGMSTPLPKHLLNY